MADEIVNLRRERKRRARAAEAAAAAEARARHGRSKAEKAQDRLAAEATRRHVDGHRRDAGAAGGEDPGGADGER